jgi:hypothetical protein
MGIDYSAVTDYRCCLCPNTGAPLKRLCPPGGPSKKPETSCRFTADFLDSGGAKIFVARLGKSWASFKQDQSGLRRLEGLPSRRSYDEAQHDWNIFADKKGWRLAMRNS